MKVTTCKHDHVEVEYSEAERAEVTKWVMAGDWEITRRGPKISNHVIVPDTFLIVAHRPLTTVKTTDKLP